MNTRYRLTHTVLIPSGWFNMDQKNWKYKFYYFGNWYNKALDRRWGQGLI